MKRGQLTHLGSQRPRSPARPRFSSLERDIAGETYHRLKQNKKIILIGRCKLFSLTE
jgi:hypothetical protein